MHPVPRQRVTVTVPLRVTAIQVPSWLELCYQEQYNMSTMSKEKDQITAYNDRVISDPRVLGGQPIVKGTRIPVEIVLEQLALDPDLNELFLDYPRLTREDVQACLDYARSLVHQARKAEGRDDAEPAPRPR